MGKNAGPVAFYPAVEEGRNKYYIDQPSHSACTTMENLQSINIKNNAWKKVSLAMGLPGKQLNTTLPSWPFSEARLS